MNADRSPIDNFYVGDSAYSCGRDEMPLAYVAAHLASHAMAFAYKKAADRGALGRPSHAEARLAQPLLSDPNFSSD